MILELKHNSGESFLASLAGHPCLRGTAAKPDIAVNKKMFPILTSRSPLFEGPGGETLHRREKQFVPKFDLAVTLV